MADMRCDFNNPYAVTTKSLSADKPNKNPFVSTGFCFSAQESQKIMQEFLELWKTKNSEQRNYVFCYYDKSNHICIIKILATGYIEALAKTYSFLGESEKLPVKDFEILCRSDNLINRATKRLEDFTGITALFFGELSKEFVNDGIKCVGGEREES